MLLVLMLEGNCQVAQRRFLIRFGHVRHVLTFDCLHETLGHAVALRATHRCGYRLLHRRSGQLITKTLFNAFQHQVADIIAAVPG